MAAKRLIHKKSALLKNLSDRTIKNDIETELIEYDRETLVRQKEKYVRRNPWINSHRMN